MTDIINAVDALKIVKPKLFEENIGASMLAVLPPPLEFTH